MTTHSRPGHHDDALAPTRNHRRTIAVAAAAVGVVAASIAVVGDADSSTDNGQQALAPGSTWS